MKILSLDVESTIYKYQGERKSTDRRGHPMSTNNFMVSLAMLPSDCDILWCYREFNVEQIQSLIDEADVVVGHNIKFDFHWLLNLGVDVYNIKQVWDTMLAEHMINNQKAESLKLRDVLLKYNLNPKLDVVENEYWNKCIDTDEIPESILREYNEYDVAGTYAVFKRQAAYFGVVL